MSLNKNSDKSGIDFVSKFDYEQNFIIEIMVVNTFRKEANKYGTIMASFLKVKKKKHTKNFEKCDKPGNNSYVQPSWKSNFDCWRDNQAL